MTLEILFNNPTKTYIAGQCVAGNIVVHSDSDTNTKGIKVKVLGTVRVALKGPVDKRARRENNRSYTDGNLLCYIFYILGDGTNNVTIPAGLQTCPFWFNLPQRLPSSFIGAYGDVTYEVEATMKKSWRFNKKVKEGITIVGSVNLNCINNDAAGPTEVRRSKTVGLHCSPSGSVKAMLKIPRMGFVVGEQLPIQVHVQNESSRRVTGITFTLTQYCTYHALGESKIESRSLPALKRRGVSSRSDRNFEENLLTLPLLPPTDQRSCRLIRICYELSMKVAMRWPYSSFILSTPIIIGTLRTAPDDSLPSHPNPIFLASESSADPDIEQPPPYHPPYESVPEFYP